VASPRGLLLELDELEQQLAEADKVAAAIPHRIRVSRSQR